MRATLFTTPHLQSITGGYDSFSTRNRNIATRVIATTKLSRHSDTNDRIANRRRARRDGRDRAPLETGDSGSRRTRSRRPRSSSTRSATTADRERAPHGRHHERAPLETGDNDSHRARSRRLRASSTRSGRQPPTANELRLKRATTTLARNGRSRLLSRSKPATAIELHIKRATTATNALRSEAVGRPQASRSRCRSSIWPLRGVDPIWTRRRVVPDPPMLVFGVVLDAMARAVRAIEDDRSHAADRVLDLDPRDPPGGGRVRRRYGHGGGWFSIGPRACSARSPTSWQLFAPRDGNDDMASTTGRRRRTG